MHFFIDAIFVFWHYCNAAIIETEQVLGTILMSTHWINGNHSYKKKILRTDAKQFHGIPVEVSYYPGLEFQVLTLVWPS